MNVLKSAVDPLHFFGAIFTIKLGKNEIFGQNLGHRGGGVHIFIYIYTYIHTYIQVCMCPGRPEVLRNVAIFTLLGGGHKSRQGVVPPFWVPKIDVLKSPKIIFLKFFQEKLVVANSFGKAMLQKGPTVRSKVQNCFGVLSLHQCFVLSLVSAGEGVRGEKMREEERYAFCCCFCYCCYSCCFCYCFVGFFSYYSSCFCYYDFFIVIIVTMFVVIVVLVVIVVSMIYNCC